VAALPLSHRKVQNQMAARTEMAATLCHNAQRNPQEQPGTTAHPETTPLQGVEASQTGHAKAP